MENLFLDWLHDNGVDLDAIVFRAPRDWCPDQYIFRFRYSGHEWSGPHLLDWGVDTFVRARNIIEEAAP